MTMTSKEGEAISLTSTLEKAFETEMIDYERLRDHIRFHPFPMLFATISGAHLYGFPSADSDFDLRGVHCLPLNTVIGLETGRQTVEKEGIFDGMEIDLVTHDAKKFFGLMLKRNGYVLEQVFSPLVVHSTPEHEELREIAKGCITKFHAHHYLGFSATQWKLFSKESPPRIKPLLYVYRVLLTGIYLMKTGRVESNLLLLNQEYGLPYIDDLVSLKIAGAEKGTLNSNDLGFHQSEYCRLVAELERAKTDSRLPDMPSSREALNDLLIRLRLSGNEKL